MSITQTLSHFAASLAADDLPPAVVARARLLTLDLIGIAVRARRDVESTPALMEAVAALGFDHGNCHVFGDDEAYGAAGAALINAALGHSLDFDDTHAQAVVHPGAPVIPAAIAAGELTGASGATVLAAIVAGYEVVLRLALALPAGAHYDRGFHPTATCGAFGAAAAAGRVFGLDGPGIASALGIALSQTAGSLQFLANGAWTKRFQVGWASMAGLTAARLAQAGFKGAADAVDGKHGFLRSYAPAPVPERAVRDLGTKWELMATGVKPYPSCRWGHAGIDAALALRQELQLQPHEIEGATLGLSRAGLLMVGEPAERKADPRNIVDGQFSGPFVVASALATGQMNWDSYNLLHEGEIRRLMPLIACVHDEDIEAEFPDNMSARITIRARGEERSHKVVVPKGEPSNFPDEAELVAKYHGLAAPVLGDAGAGVLQKEVLQLDSLPTVAALFSSAGPV